MDDGHKVVVADCEVLRNSDLYRPAVGSANGLPQEEMREPTMEDF
jgi:hypothetical protein